MKGNSLKPGAIQEAFTALKARGTWGTIGSGGDREGGRDDARNVDEGRSAGTGTRANVQNGRENPGDDLGLDPGAGERGGPSRGRAGG